MKRYPWLLSILLVYPDGSGPYPNIQSAVDAAQDGDEVHLAQHFERGVETFQGEGNRDINLQGKAIVVKSADENPAHAEIVLVGPEYESHRVFTITQGEGRDCRIEYVTIRASINTYGGGLIYMNLSTPTIKDCYFTGNQGTCILSLSAFPLIENCHFSDNTGTVVLAWSNLIGFSKQAEILNCSFSGNSSGENFSAVYLDRGLMKDCHFYNNVSIGDGGSLTAGPGATIENTTLSGTTGEHGAAVLAYGGAIFRDCVMTTDVPEDETDALAILPSPSYGEPCVQLFECEVKGIYFFTFPEKGCCIEIKTAPEEPVRPLSLDALSWGSIKGRYR